MDELETLSAIIEFKPENIIGAEMNAINIIGADIFASNIFGVQKNVNIFFPTTKKTVKISPKSLLAKSSSSILFIAGMALAMFVPLYSPR